MVWWGYFKSKIEQNKKSISFVFAILNCNLVKIDDLIINGKVNN